MSGARLHTLLPELTTRQSVMVVGAAVIDVIADAYALPWRGCDIELKQQRCEMRNLFQHFEKAVRLTK